MPNAKEISRDDFNANPSYYVRRAKTPGNQVVVKQNGKTCMILGAAKPTRAQRARARKVLLRLGVK